MRSYAINKELIKVILIAISCMFLFSGCSTFQKLARTLNLFDKQGNEHHIITDKHIKEFASVVRPTRETADSFYQQAKFHESRKRYKLAIEYFEKVISIDPHYIKAYNGMGVSFDLLGNYSKAAECYNKALAISPDLDYVQNNLGYSYLLQRKTSSAIDAFKRAIILNEKNSRYHNNLALALADIGDYEAAFDEFKRAGNDADAHYNLGRYFYQSGAYDQAASHFNQALALEPSKGDLLDPSEEITEALARFLPQKERKSGIDQNMGDEFSLNSKAKEKKQNLHTNSISKSLPERCEKTHRFESVGKSDANKKIHNNNHIYGSLFKKIRSPLAYEIKKSQSENKLPQGTTKSYHSTSANIELPVVEKKLILNQHHHPSDLYIEISNGNGVYHMARMVGDYLKRYEYENIRLTNAENFNYCRTTIYYRRGYLRSAYEIAKSIPGWQEMIEVVEFVHSETNIRVLIGRDIVPCQELFGTLAERKPNDSNWPIL